MNSIRIFHEHVTMPNVICCYT